MVNEKHLFIAIGVLVAAFFGFMLYESSGRPDYSSHAIDESIPTAAGGSQPAGNAQLQVVSVRALSSGVYDNPQLTVKAGLPVRLDFTAEPGSGCGAQLIVDGVGAPVNLVSRNGQTVSATFTPPSPGQYRFHCGMNMFRGVLIAT